MSDRECRVRESNPRCRVESTASCATERTRHGALGRNRTDASGLRNSCTTVVLRGRASGWTRTNTLPGKNRLLCLGATEAMRRRGGLLPRRRIWLSRPVHTVSLSFRSGTVDSPVLQSAAVRAERVELSFPESESGVLPIERNPSLVVCCRERVTPVCSPGCRKAKSPSRFFLDGLPNGLVSLSYAGSLRGVACLRSAHHSRSMRVAAHSAVVSSRCMIVIAV